MGQYKRVLLKLSGEALAGEKGVGFDEATCIPVAEQIKALKTASRWRLSSAAAISGEGAPARR